MSLNNYSKTISNIKNFIKNSDLALNVYKIEEGETKVGLYKDGSRYFYNIPLISNINIDELISLKFEITFDKQKFLNFYNRYITPYCRDRGVEDDSFPICINNIFEILKVNKNFYDIDNIVETFLINPINEYGSLDCIIESNKILKEDFNNSINIILSKYPYKILLYKSGKLGLLGFFIGECVKETKGNPKVIKELVESILNK